MAGQDCKAGGSGRTFDDFDLLFAAFGLDLLGKGVARVAAVHTEFPQPGGPAQQGPGTVALGDVGGGDQHPEHQAHRVHQQVALAPLDIFGGIVAYRAAAGRGLHALAVQNGGGGAAVLACGLAHQRPQAVIEALPGVILGQVAEDMIHGLPRRIALGQQGPEHRPLCVGEIGVVDSDSHRLDGRSERAE